MDKIIEIGQEINGYNFLKCLGRNENNEVWLVSLKEAVYAMKVIKRFNSTSENEKKIADNYGISCPFVVKYFLGFKNSQKFFVVSEFCSGGNLQDYINNMKDIKEQIDFEPALKILIQLSLALFDLHYHGICHRYLKPQNILLTKDYDVKISDFAYSCMIDSKNELGALGYTAPEILDGQSYDQKADVFALGVLMYYLCTFQMPFASEAALRNVEFEPISESKFLPKFCEIIYSMLNAKPVARPSAHQILENELIQEYAGRFKMLDNFHADIRRRVSPPASNTITPNPSPTSTPTPTSTGATSGAVSLLDPELAEFISLMVQQGTITLPSAFRVEFEGTLGRKPTLSEINFFLAECRRQAAAPAATAAAAAAPPVPLRRRPSAFGSTPVPVPVPALRPGPCGGFGLGSSGGSGGGLANANMHMSGLRSLSASTPNFSSAMFYQATPSPYTSPSPFASGASSPSSSSFFPSSSEALTPPSLLSPSSLSTSPPAAAAGAGGGTSPSPTSRAVLYKTTPAPSTASYPHADPVIFRSADNPPEPPILHGIMFAFPTPNDSYEGSARGGLPHGRGVCRYGGRYQGDVYEGDWVNGRKEGRGTCTFANGDKYVGEWVRDRREGRGTCRMRSGNVYEGDWKRNKFDGKGKFTWRTGGQYVGEYANHMRNGQGTLTDGEGRVLFEGLWKDDAMQK